MDEVRARHPAFWSAVVADARIRAAYRRERFEFRSRADGILQVLRLAWASDAFLAQALYRLKARLQALSVPILPRLLQLLACILAQVEIGDAVVIEPGVQIAHGQVSIGGFTVIRTGTTIAPFVSIGLRSGTYNGPVIEEHVEVGTGARVLGPVRRRGGRADRRQRGGDQGRRGGIHRGRRPGPAAVGRSHVCLDLVLIAFRLLHRGVTLTRIR